MIARVIRGITGAAVLSMAFAGALVAQTYSYTGPVVPITDNTPAGVDTQVAVAGAPTSITDVNFRIDGTGADASAGVDHSWAGDLILTLTSPGGTSVVLIDRPGVPATTFGCSNDDYFGTTLDDAAGGGPIENVCANGMSGNFTPNNPLSAFNGQNANGNWTLNVSDNAAGDTGAVRLWSVIITGTGGACTPTITCPADQVAAAPPGASGSTVAYPAPVVGGDCTAPIVSCLPASGDFFPVGTSTVVCTVTEGAASATCNFDVTVGNEAIQEIPTASSLGLAALALLLAGAAFLVLRRHS